MTKGSPPPGDLQSRNSRVEMLQRRRGITLTIILSLVYFGFIFLVVFAPRLMARPVFGVVSLGIVFAFAEIAFAVLVTGVYVWSANADERA